MATMQFTVEDVHLVSGWTIKTSGGATTVSAPTTEKTTRTFSFAALPAGSIINSARISCTRRGTNAGSIRTVDGIHDAVSSTSDIAIATSRISGGGNLQIEFVYRATSYGGTAGYHTGGTYWENIVLTVDYTGYTACTAPTSVSLNKTTAMPSESLTLSWSGAKAGLNNAISKYEVYRSTSAGGTYSKIGETNAATLKLTVSAPSAAGSYHYKVKAVGSVSGYSSGLSSARAAVTVNVTAPGAPTGLSVSPASQYPAGNATLSWTAPAAGTNNPITGYMVYASTRADGAYNFLKNASVTSCTVTTPQAGSLYFKVLAVGTYLNGPLSSAYGTLTVDMSGTSDFSCSPDPVDAGTVLTLTLSTNTNKAHTAVFSIGNYSQTVQSSAGAASITFTPPLTWLNAMPGSLTAAMTVKLTTAGAGTVIKTVSLRCPDSVVPTGVNGSAAPYSAAVPAAWGIYAAKLSAATVTLNTAASAPYGASIALYRIEGPGVYVEGSALPLSATSHLLPQGSHVYTLSAIDSRGRIGKKQISVTVLPYAAPTLQNILSLRTDSQGQEEDEGTYVLAAADIVFSSLNSHNAASCAVAYRRQGTDTWNSAGTLSNGRKLFGSGGISLPYNWEIRYTVTDSLGQSNVYYDIVTRAVWELHVKRGGGAWAFGGVADMMGALKVYGQIAASLGNVPTAVCDINGDLDNATTPGLYTYTGSYSNVPIVAGGVLMVVKNDYSTYQVAYVNNTTYTPMVYMRNKYYTQGSWSAWVQLTGGGYSYPYKRSLVLNTTASVSTTNGWANTGLTVNLTQGHLYAISVAVGSGGGVYGVQLRMGGTVHFEHTAVIAQSMANLNPVFSSDATGTYEIWVNRAGTGSASYRVSDIGVTVS